MPKLTPQQRAKLVRYFYLNGESPVAALRAYGRETGNYAACDAKLVKKWANQFLQTGSVNDAARSGRPKINDDNVMKVSLSTADLSQAAVHHDANIRKVTETTGLAHSTVWKILQKLLASYPYCINFLHELHPADHQRRVI